jgi:hypothetical protein
LERPQTHPSSSSSTDSSNRPYVKATGAGDSKPCTRILWGRDMLQSDAVGRRLRKASPQQQHDLLLADAGAPAVTAPKPALPPPTEHRAIHYSGYDRERRDFYATPDWVTEALLQHIHFRGPIWEPCCGDGAMSSILAVHGYDVVSTDIADRGFGTPGVDFLTCHKVPQGCRSIVTNPPYGDTGSHAGQSRSPRAMLGFLRHALALTASVRGQLALLVRLQWIAGQRAADVMSAAPFAAVLVLNQRIRWFDMGERTNAAQHHHAWVVFDHGHPPGCPPALLYA